MICLFFSCIILFSVFNENSVDPDQMLHSGSTLFVHCKGTLSINGLPKFSNRYAWANSADPDQTAPRGGV